jgi:hypothetical protein
LFEDSISKLSQNGIYIIKDVLLDDLLMYNTYFDTKDFAVDYVIMFRPDAEHNGDVRFRGWLCKKVDDARRR